MQFLTNINCLQSVSWIIKIKCLLKCLDSWQDGKTDTKTETVSHVLSVLLCCYGQNWTQEPMLWISNNQDGSSHWQLSVYFQADIMQSVFPINQLFVLLDSAGWRGRIYKKLRPGKISSQTSIPILDLSALWTAWVSKLKKWSVRYHDLHICTHSECMCCSSW